jgi:hypothetical protein
VWLLLFAGCTKHVPPSAGCSATLKVGYTIDQVRSACGTPEDEVSIGDTVFLHLRDESGAARVVGFRFGKVDLVE